MNKQEKYKKVYEMSVQLEFPVHKFNDTQCTFYKGFKFERVSEKDKPIRYAAYNTRSMGYKELLESEVDAIIEHGIRVISSVLSQEYYMKVVDKDKKILSNPSVNIKTASKATNEMNHYLRKIDDLLKNNPENIGLFKI